MATATAQADPPVAWEPHPGSQTLFLSCPFREVLYTGTRGPGKSDGLLMDFAQHVGQGFGADWRGVLFRHEYKPLAEIVRKAEKWFRRIFPRARFLRSQSDYRWIWPDGEELLFRAFKKPSDYWDYHGHEYPWIGWEELTAWPDLSCYHVMKSCNRSSNPDVPLKYRANCNPYGPGHNAVKAYFIDPAPAGVPFVPDASDVDDMLSEMGVDADSHGWKAVTLHGHYSENAALMDADPGYPATIARAASNPEQAKAWLSDDWDIVAGGMFDDVWSRERHVLPVFDVPRGWRLYRSFDWGSSKPFSVGWWAEANGEAAELPDGITFRPPPRSRIRWAEWYGWNGKPNEGLRLTDTEIAKGIVEREEEWGIRDRVEPGPADPSIFSADPGHVSPAEALRKAGAEFTAADAGSGSVVRGCEAMRRMLREAAKDRPEEPGLWVTERCRHFIRTVPTLPRDERDLDRYDTEAEDHIADETRYALDVKPAMRATLVESPWG